MSKAVAEADLNVLAITCLDLTTTDHQKVLFECLCKANVGSLHIAPPCGTASRAREIPMNESSAMPRPKPLRSAEDLWGDSLPSSQVDRLRVQAANTLYVVSVVAASIAVRSSLVSVEIPSNLEAPRPNKFGHGCKTSKFYFDMVHVRDSFLVSKIGPSQGPHKHSTAYLHKP